MHRCFLFVFFKFAFCNDGVQYYQYLSPFTYRASLSKTEPKTKFEAINFILNSFYFQSVSNKDLLLFEEIMNDVSNSNLLNYAKKYLKKKVEDIKTLSKPEAFYTKDSSQFDTINMYLNKISSELDSNDINLLNSLSGYLLKIKCFINQSDELFAYEKDFLQEKSNLIFFEIKKDIARLM